MLPIRMWGMMEGRWTCGLRPHAFAIFMWRDGGEGEEEFVTLPTPITILAQ